VHVKKETPKEERQVLRVSTFTIAPLQLISTNLQYFFNGTAGG